ncbi:hypothetical protein [Moorella sp. Hama-1]|uniref:hypothetical protein n=1 Tax=Moorella sp. Hama-1 TaxID=2138101 RepID=UPI000D64F822|nr:hypothetical protein [Moorella sp. Hama-1]BCV22374.1 DUF1640 domain-containing protein [Moorella sp. Hama-1]
MASVPEKIIQQEIEKGEKEVAAGEDKVVDFGSYLLLEKISDLQSNLQKQVTEVKESLRQEMKQEIGGLRQEMKQEIGGLHQEIGSLRQEMKQEIGSLRQEMKEEIRHLDGKLNNTILAAIGVFFAVLLGSASIVWTIYHAIH